MGIFRKLLQFVREPLIEKPESLSHWYWLVKTQAFYRHSFRSLGSGTRIIKPLRLKNVQHISLGRDVLVHKYCWLQAQHAFERPPQLVIGDGCVLGNFNHITCAESVTIEEKVLTADRVFITDHGHEYRDPDQTIMDQGITRGRPVVIGRGSWIGENVVIMSCRIGRNSVIGANSVVMSDIPDFCVAVGTPAKVIKRFNVQKKEWERACPLLV